MNNTLPTPAIEGFSSESAQVGDVRLHYWLGGDPDGPPVLLWHGFLATGYTWHQVAPALAEAGLRVLVPDMRGFGDSEKPDGTQGYDARALAQEFRALVAQIGFGRANDGARRPITLVAHDMGGPPALLWAADHPEEIAQVLYVDAPVMLSDILTQIIAYTPEAMQNGSMWWVLALAPDVPRRLIVGRERAFLSWFHQFLVVDKNAIQPEKVDEILRTFAGEEGVLGALGVFRAAFTSIEQTTPLLQTKVRVPMVTLGGEQGLGERLGGMVSLVAENVESHVIAGCGHFVPEERPEAVIRQVLAMTTPGAANRD